MAFETFLAWFVLAVGFALGSLGTIVPGLPGALFVVAGVVGHKFLRPETFSWTVVGIIAALAVVSWIVDWLGGTLGAKLGGASKYGMLGATVGGLAGIPFGLPGWILGPFFGAIVGDIYAKRYELLPLLRSGAGAMFGFVLALIARLMLLGVMAVVILVSAFL